MEATDHRGADPPLGIRLDAVAGLQDVAPDLIALGITDVVIMPISVAGTTCWAAEIFLENEFLQFAWALDPRPTKDEASAAVEKLLRGLASGRAAAVHDHPAVAFLNEDDVANARRAQQGALVQMEADHMVWKEAIDGGA